MSQETVNLVANGQEVLRIPGRHVAVIRCTAPFKVEADNQGKRTMRAGRKFSTAEEFSKLTFYETEGAANEILLHAGESDYEGAVPLAVEETFDYPYLMPADGTTLAVSGSAYTQLPETIAVAGTNYNRKSFHLSNRTSSDLGIYRTTGELMDVLLQNSERTFDISGDLKMKGIGGSPSVALYYRLING